ncbi:MAG: 23S rRNA (guanosine(2251)-2'-O)-methyltransferase RlmB [Rhodospirillaceae bacterium]|nr:23S rRNA (guanosine(2251)-2'-O)-methyltransferase RlmB [Rhodospirillaceae bacterium]
MDHAATPRDNRKHEKNVRAAPGPNAESDNHGRRTDGLSRRDPGHSATKLPPESRGGPSSGTGSGHGQGAGGGNYWVYGHHAVAAALGNPQRRIQRILAVDDAAAAIGRGEMRGAGPTLPPIEAADRDTLDRLLGRDAVHQGIAARVAPLPETDIYEICDLAQSRERASVVVLDQVTDPHNVGAILRSAAAFGALAIILTERHAAPESGVLAKAASGALEHVPIARVTNLVRAMGALKEAGFWCLGLAAEGRQTLAEVKSGGRIALCLGAEGAGLRRLTREHCDLLVRLPTSGPIDHLNVSNAAAISLYEMVR